MKVIELQNSFGIENLKLTERDAPEPGPGQVLLKMKAMSLNYRDYLMVTGNYNPRLKMPLIPLSDGVGEVVETGEGVTRVKQSDRVAPIFAQKWLSGKPHKDVFKSTLGGPADGTLTEYMLLSEEGVVKIPGFLTDEEAATLPCAALTAWSALVTYGNITAGDTVLVLGTGGVSIFALQFARLLGATVIATSSSDEKLEKAKELGAHEVINYRDNKDWSKTVRKATGGEGVDLVIEVGGAGTLEHSIKSVKHGGAISLIGILAGSGKDLNLLPVLMRNIQIQGILVGHREGFEQMNRAIEAHQMKPVVDKVFEFENAPAAIEELSKGNHFGKISIKL